MKSFILTANTASSTVASGGVVPLGSAVHGFGCGIKLNGNTIQIKQRGYYNIAVSVSAAVTGTGELSAALYADGASISGATSSATPGAAGDVVALSFNWVVRKSCCFDPTALTVVLSDAATVNNVIVEVSEL